MLEMLAERGYRRIGVALISNYESVHGYDSALGIDQFRRLGRHPEVVVEETYITRIREIETDLMPWFHAKRLDAVVSLQPEVGETITRLRTPAGRVPGYAVLARVPRFSWSGVEQNLARIGVTGMEFFRSLLLNGERGLAMESHIVLIKGTWQDVTSTPDIPPAGVPCSDSSVAGLQ